MIERVVKLILIMNLVDPIRDERFNQMISLNKVANERGKEDEEDATRRLVSP
jgi:hypothetical protein